MHAASHPAVVVSPASAYDFEHEHFAKLVFELIKDSDLLADQVEIRLGYLYGDAWPPGWTWVTLVLDKAASEAITAVVTAVLIWGREWISKARRKDPDAKPIKAVIYGPGGELPSRGGSTLGRVVISHKPSTTGRCG